MTIKAFYDTITSSVSNKHMPERKGSHMTENEKMTVNSAENEKAEETIEVTEAGSESEVKEQETDASEALASDYSYTNTALSGVAEAKELPPENIFLGIIGAFLFSLVGALLFFVLYQAGRVAAICGFVTVVCAIKGYSIFGKRENVRSIVIATVISLITIIIAEFLSYSFLLYDSGWLSARVEHEIPFYAIPFEALDFLMTNTDYIPDLLIEYALVIGMSALGAFTQIRNALSAAKLNAQNRK